MDSDKYTFPDNVFNDTDFFISQLRRRIASKDNTFTFRLWSPNYTKRVYIVPKLLIA